jgi:hypothetical protein
VSDFYTTMAAVTQRMFASDMFADAVLTRVTRAFDRLASTTTSTTALLPCRAVAKPETIMNDNGQKQHDMTIIMNIEPQVDDLIQIGGHKYRVEEVIRVAPNGNALVYKAKVCA